MSKPKITKEMRELLIPEYEGFVAEYKGDQKKVHVNFFQFMRENFDAFDGVGDKQMLGVLVQAKVYKPTNPRQEPKKAGRTKAGLVAELETLVGAALPSAMKLTMSELDILIDKLTPKE